VKVAVIYNEPKHTPAAEHWLKRSTAIETSESFVDASEFGVLEQMESIAAAVQEAGHEVVIFSTDDDVNRLCNFLTQEEPDVIFNCCESIMGESKLEMNVAAMYELYGIPYTGSSALTLGIALNKGLTKAILASRGIPTPRYAILESDELSATRELTYPLITKPIGEDASIGIDSGAVVHDEVSLGERVRFLLSEFRQPVLAEEFVDGREMNVGMIANSDGILETLPISEITFDQVPEGMPKIVSYEAKWVEESPLYKTTLPVCPAPIDERLAAETRRIAREAAQAIGLRDYGRVDLRIDANDRIFVLEANPNPDISEDAGFMRAARASGRTYAGTINEILARAIERSKDSSR
jgi:D-alanine-D-alanine ligase